MLPVITTTINKSLQNGNFPNCWKEALVLPLLKKQGLDITFKNFRPVSNLPFISKVTEKAVFDQTYNLMVENDLYPPNQSSYRKNHSTETALSKVTNDILLNTREIRMSSIRWDVETTSSQYEGKSEFKWVTF